MSKLRVLHTVFAFMALYLVKAQQIVDADAAFTRGRDLAFQGERSMARDSLEALLEVYPEYTDATILIAKTYSWDGDYEEARKRLNRITSKKKEARDAWLAAIRNEVYAENTNIALGLANKALIHLKQDEEIETLREQLRTRLNEVPEIQDRLKKENRQKATKNTLSVTTNLEVFDQQFDPMYLTTIEYQRGTSLGKIIPRVTFGERFNITGAQFEVDAYPTISKKLNGYLNYGYSNSVIFPKHRFGAELFAELPNALEVSLGARHVQFTTTNATIFTGSFGLYRGNYYLSARPYVSTRNDGQIGTAGTVIARRYGKDGSTYFGLRASYGFDSELNQFIVDGQLLSETQLFVESQELLLEYQFSAANATSVYGFNAGVRRQELFSNANSFFWAFSAGLRYQFNF